LLAREGLSVMVCLARSAVAAHRERTFLRTGLHRQKIAVLRGLAAAEVALHAHDPTDDISLGGLASRSYESDTQRHLAEPRS
jgi:hypothetical protein